MGRPTRLVDDRLATDLRRLGRHLAALGYDEERLRRRLGSIPSRTSPDDVAMAVRRLGDDDLAGAARFWILGLPAARSEAHAALGPVTLEPLSSAGLIEPRAAELVPRVRITPLGELLLAHDADDGGTLSRDHVVGVGAATRTLADLTPRVRVARTLDLGTGNGVQALLAARHSKAVVATDINARAAWLAGVGSALNGIDGVEIRVGDAFEPVGNELFDLIVANPPFVVSPDRALTFRDSPLGGDVISRDVVRGAAERLRTGGTAVVLTNWVVRDGSAPIVEPGRWVADLDGDSLILHHDTLDPIAYAQRWMLPEAAGGGKADMLDRWLGHYEAIGVVGIASGAIVLRRTGSPTRVRATRMHRRPADGGEHVERILGAIGRFSGPDDERLAETRFVLVEPHELEQRLSYEGGGYRAGEARLRLRRSAGIEARLAADLLEVLFAIDGERPLAGIVDDVATARGESPTTLRARALPAFLELYERGFLVEAPAGQPGSASRAVDSAT